jgi:hypothetical protein
MAFRVLLEQYRQEKSEMEQRVASSVHNSILPVLARLYEASEKKSCQDLSPVVTIHHLSKPHVPGAILNLEPPTLDFLTLATWGNPELTLFLFFRNYSPHC